MLLNIRASGNDKDDHRVIGEGFKTRLCAFAPWRPISIRLLVAYLAYDVSNRGPFFSVYFVDNGCSKQDSVSQELCLDNTILSSA